MLYAILPRSDWDGTTPVHESAGAIIVHVSKLNDRVTELCGRNPLGFRSVRDALHRSGRVYIAAVRGGGYLVATVPA